MVFVFVGPMTARAQSDDPMESGVAVESLRDGGDVVLGADGEPVFGHDVPLDDPGHRALRAFHDALDRSARGEGQARIVVYGASHVASDLATHTLRTLLQREFGDAGHGFVLPAQPWPHYRHVDVDVDGSPRPWQVERVRAGAVEPGRYGLAGVALTTDSARAFGRISTGSHHASRFELFYWRQPGGGSMEIFIDGVAIRRVSTHAAEAGPEYALFHVPDAPHSFELRARGDGPITVFGVSAEREVPGVIVDTLGINGARAASQLLWDEALWSEHLRRRAPDLVVLAYGTNESGDDDQPIERYEASLRQVVDRVRRSVPGASCMLVGPSDRPIRLRDGTFVERPRTAQVVDTQRRVAAETGCAFFDLVAFGGGPMHMVTWAALDPAWAQRDHVHFTLRGYARLGQVLHGALLDGYEGPFGTERVVTARVAPLGVEGGAATPRGVAGGTGIFDGVMGGGGTGGGGTASGGTLSAASR